MSIWICTGLETVRVYEFVLPPTRRPPLQFCQHDLTFGTRNALSFLSLQCREKKEKESEPKLWPRGHIQPATIHQYTIVAHAHDCSSAGSPPSLIRIVDKARRAHIVMSLNWAHVRARDERKMGENNS